jgi:hypothetical protein
MHRRYLRLKACPRCHGDILIDSAMEDGEVCIQCGYRKFTPVEQPSDARDLEKTTELKVDRRAGRKALKNK